MRVLALEINDSGLRVGSDEAHQEAGPGYAMLDPERLRADLGSTRVEPLADPLQRRLAREEGVQTAEAIGIAAVGIVVLSGIMVLLEVLGVDVVNWMRGRFGVGS